VKPLDVIESRDNSLIKEVKKLKEKKHRIEKEQFLIEGFRFVEEALKSSFEVPYIFLSEEAQNRYEDFKLHEKLQSGTKIYLVKDSILKQLSSTETPQGIAAVVKNKAVDLQNKQGFYILVDKLQDPGNMGTIIRSAHASGAIGIIMTKGTVDPYNEKTLRSTMGSIFNIEIIEDFDLSKTKGLKNSGFKLIVSSLEDSQDFFTVDLSGKVIIAVGNEGSGISDEIYSLEDIRVKIPMPGGAESLNAGAAASIMMFEIVRQKLTIK
jgi:TrmH family RNA methyltransferase